MTPHGKAHSDLRLAHLKDRVVSGARLMNVKIPAGIKDRIEVIANELGVTITDTVVALLNEGLALAQHQMKGHQRE